MLLQPDGLPQAQQHVGNIHFSVFVYVLVRDTGIIGNNQAKGIVINFGVDVHGLLLPVESSRTGSARARPAPAARTASNANRIFILVSLWNCLKKTTTFQVQKQPAAGVRLSAQPNGLLPHRFHGILLIISLGILVSYAWPVSAATVLAIEVENLYTLPEITQKLREGMDIQSCFLVSYQNLKSSFPRR